MLEVKGLSASYSKKGREILSDVSFRLKEGEIGVLLGPNGAGKSTLFQSLLGIVKPKNGEILLNGKSSRETSAREWAQSIAYVPQRVTPSGLSVFETVLLGRMPYFGFSPRGEEQKTTEKVLSELGLLSLKEKRTDQLSGGELQKVAIATALNQNPSLLLFDEPTSNLDVSNCVLFANLCKNIAKTKRISILIALHDLNMALDLGDRFFFLREGQLLAQGGQECFNEENVLSTFGVSVSISGSGGDRHIHFHHHEEEPK